VGNRGRVGSAIEDGSGGKSTTGQVRNRGRVGWVIDDEWGVGNRRVGTRGPKKQRSSSPSFFVSSGVRETAAEQIFSIYLLISGTLSLAFLLLFICFHHVRFLPPSIIYNLVSVSVASI
jgi:hypothetical protein